MPSGQNGASQNGTPVPLTTEYIDEKLKQLEQEAIDRKTRKRHVLRNAQMEFATMRKYWDDKYNTDPKESNASIVSNVGSISDMYVL